MPERPSTLMQACPRHPAAKLKGLLPAKFLEALEQNQFLAHCCRHPETHDVEAFRSRPEEEAPDVYVFHCNGCGRKHRRFCIGGGDQRPFWDIK